MVVVVVVVAAVLRLLLQLREVQGVLVTGRTDSTSSFSSTAAVAVVVEEPLKPLSFGAGNCWFMGLSRAKASTFFVSGDGGFWATAHIEGLR